MTPQAEYVFQFKVDEMIVEYIFDQPMSVHDIIKFIQISDDDQSKQIRQYCAENDGAEFIFDLNPLDSVQ